MASCPLARWSHQSGHDHNASFGLHVEEGGQSNFNCFGCCRSGSAEELLQAIEMYCKGDPGGRDFKSARALLDEELDILPLEYSVTSQEQVFSPWSQAWLDSFYPVGACPQARAYLDQRTVPEDTWLKHELKYDNLRRMIVAPYWNAHGTLAGARGRSVLQDTMMKHYDYTWNGVNNARLVWYNEPCLTLPGWVVVVEGQFDCWRVEQRWDKVVANLTAKLTWEKMKKLAYSDGVIHLPDPDEAGEVSAVEAAVMAKEMGLPYRRIQLPQLPPMEFAGGTLKPLKMDPDRCHPDFLYNKIVESIGGF